MLLNSWDLTDEEAQELGRRSIFHATHRDAASGGIIRVYHVSELNISVST
jgi:20S proteasome subunit beta 5